MALEFNKWSYALGIRATQKATWIFKSATHPYSVLGKACYAVVQISLRICWIISGSERKETWTESLRLMNFVLKTSSMEWLAQKAWMPSVTRSYRRTLMVTWILRKWLSGILDFYFHFLVYWIFTDVQISKLYFMSIEQ